MTDKKNPLGPIGHTVRENIERLRKERRMSYRELSEALAASGRRIPPLGLSRVEDGTRRVDADDLVALAIVLDVSPVALLLPHEPTDDGAGLTSEIRADWRDAWRWAVGEQPLTRSGERVTLSDPAVARFIAENRPFERHSLVDEIGRWLVSRSSNPNPLRYVVEISHNGEGEWQGQATITAGDDGQRQ